MGSYSDGQHAVGHSSQDILRTHGGTVSQISKQVVSPHSSVTKSVTTVNNDGYKAVSYQPSAAYHQVAQTYAYQPATPVEIAPAVATKTISYQPQYTKTYATEPQQVHYQQAAYYQHQQPATVTKSIQYHQPAHHQAAIAYHHQQPAQTIQYAAAPIATKTISYQPAAKTSYTTYSAPQKTSASIEYAAPATVSYHHHQQQPTHTQVQYAAPVQVAKTQVQYAAVPHHQQQTTYVTSATPSVVATKTVAYEASPVAKSVTYAAAAPAVATKTYVSQDASPSSGHYASHAKTFTYSPATEVSHFSFESPAAHYAW